MSKTLSQIATALESDKNAIRQAILSGGGTCPEEHGFDDFADDIDSIPSGGSSSLILNNANAKPSIKGEFADFPVWVDTNIVSENTSGTMSLGKTWTDGTDVYCSNGGSAIIKYIDSLNMWATFPGSWSKTSSSLTLYSQDIWTDGENIYHSYNYLNTYVYMYVLDKNTMKWESKSWTFYGTTAPATWYGRDIWVYKDTVYLCTETKGNFVLNKTTGNFESRSWNIYIESGANIWTDGEHIYYSNQYGQYVLNEETMEWETKTWTYSFDYRGFCGKFIWTDGTNIYISGYYQVSTSSSTYTYYVYAVLDKETDTWINKTWTGMSNWYASGIWNYKNEVYYLNGTTYKKLNKTTGEFEPYTFRFASNSNSLASSGNGCYMWYDGSDIYYSNGTTQQVFDKDNEVFLNTTWTGLTNFDGRYIWSDGTDIYYSNGSTQYVLDKTNKTWSIKTWTGLTNFYSLDIWSDGTNIYYSSSNSNSQYVLDTDTSTWSVKTWTGLTIFDGRYIWSDGTDIYCYSSSKQYVLDTDTSTWSTSSLNSSISGYNIWTDGEHIYSNDYVYNKNTHSTTSVFSGVNAYNIWTDGENVYLNSSVSSATSVKVRKLIKEKNPIPLTAVTTPNSKIPFNPT